MLATHHYGRTGWRGLLLASALVLVAALTAFSQGTIVYTRMPLNIVPPQFPWDAEGYRAIGDWGGTGSPYGSVSVDINQDGQDDYLFTWGMNFGMRCLQGNKLAAYLLVPWDSGNVSALAPGAVIGDSMSLVGWMGAQDSPYTFLLSGWRDIGDPSYIGAGEFAGMESAYAGLQLQINGNTHYGWIRLGAPLPFLNGGWIYDYAYEARPGVPILAGAIPEPSTWALLVGGGVLMVSFKRNRNERKG